jgi:hypothetical protein
VEANGFRWKVSGTEQINLSIQDNGNKETIKTGDVVMIM